MGWKAYRLVYQAKSPIHIGWHTLGYIKLTRYYITGKAMWGAFTANLTRTGEEKTPEAYKKYGELFRKDVLFSYFYPAIDPDIPLLPEFTDEGLKYSGCTESEFKSLFIKSYGQTAVLPDSNTAEDESLHESEFIAPVVRDEETKEQRPVYFVGYIFIKDGVKVDDQEFALENIENAIKEIFVGGDRKYGWGRLVLDEKKPPCETNEVFGYRFDTNIKDGTSQITIPINKPIPAHFELNRDAKLKGDIEPLVGREWGERKVKEDNKEAIHEGFGQEITGAKICWMPGSILGKDETLKIQAYGILSKLGE